VVDDRNATLTGPWIPSSAVGRWVGAGYRHDNDARDGRATARFEARLPESGRYEVRLAYTAHENRASNLPVAVHHAEGIETIELNQRLPPPIDGLFISLGTFEFSRGLPAAVVVSNRETDGHVVIDAVQWLP
jgi:hypothetical protein